MGYLSLHDLFVLIVVRKNIEKTHMRVLGYKHIFQRVGSQEAKKERLKKYYKNAEDLEVNPIIRSYMKLAVMAWLIFSKNGTRSKHLKSLNHPKNILRPVDPIQSSPGLWKLVTVVVFFFLTSWSSTNLQRKSIMLSPFYRLGN